MAKRKRIDKRWIGIVIGFVAVLAIAISATVVVMSGDNRVAGLSKDEVIAKVTKVHPGATLVSSRKGDDKDLHGYVADNVQVYEFKTKATVDGENKEVTFPVVTGVMDTGNSDPVLYLWDRYMDEVYDKAIQQKLIDTFGGRFDDTIQDGNGNAVVYLNEGTDVQKLADTVRELTGFKAVKNMPSSYQVSCDSVIYVSQGKDANGNDSYSAYTLGSLVS